MIARERSDAHAGGRIDAYDGFRFDCTFCEDVLRAESVESLKDRGVAHLESHGETELLPVFTETYGGEDCHDDCGYVFPVGIEEVSGFDCPSCGHDNFRPFVKRYLYWQIETE